ncbi:MAG: nucleotide sugar dehydrogenase [Firmicutes bacterium]|nr:nucleotide sugar dehydrogenase [Bacillota bacterium]MDH7496242.1 nucleotide sugar dehydrogenase [Bacillota bacterium]
MKVCIVGLGYIGFPTACVVAQAGHDVLGIDLNREIVDKLNHGGIHILNEDGLAEIAREAFASGHLRVSEHAEPGDVFILAVPTPCRPVLGCDRANEVKEQVAAASHDSRGETGIPGQYLTLQDEHHDIPTFSADLSYVEQAACGVAPYIRPGNLVILESTVSPGTTNTLVRKVLEAGSGLTCGKDFYLAHAPERVLPGHILRELIENDRIIGGVDDKSTEQAVAFYRTFVRGNVIGTDSTTAEVVKLMENTYRDVNIALANEFALICEELGVNVFQTIALANRHPRVNVLKPGPGVGGHCIAVDPYFLIEAVPEKARLISVARQVNSAMPLHVLSLFCGMVDESKALGRKTEKVTALGVSYKADVGDERESPSLQVIERIRAAGYDVVVHDPYVPRFSGYTLEDAIRGADAVVLLTDHTVYRSQFVPEKVVALMRQRLILDTRGFCGEEWDRAGFRVVRLGVGTGEQRCWRARL